MVPDANTSAHESAQHGDLILHLPAVLDMKAVGWARAQLTHAPYARAILDFGDVRVCQPLAFASLITCAIEIRTLPIEARLSHAQQLKKLGTFDLVMACGRA